MRVSSRERSQRARSSRRDEGEELQEERGRRHLQQPDTVRPLPSHLGQIHLGLDWDAASGPEDILLLQPEYGLAGVGHVRVRKRGWQELERESFIAQP